MTVRTPGGLDPADGHAQVLGVDHHPGPARAQVLVQVLGGRVGPDGLQQRPGGPLGRLQVDPAEGPGDPEAPVGDAGHRAWRLVAAVGRMPAPG